MKKNFKYAILGAIALGGAVGFSACSSSDEIVDNPNYNPETNAVKTQFTISFPGNVAKTRQAPGIVQAGENISDFRGMDEIVLYPFGETSKGGSTPVVNPVTSSSKKLGEAITLTKMIKPTTNTVSNVIPAYSGDGTGLTTGSNSVLYNDVTIPIGTGSFLFYGKAINSSTSKFYNGELTKSGDEPSSIKFDLSASYTPSTEATAVGTALATYLTSIAGAKDGDAEICTWAECADPSKSAKSGYNAALGQLYTNFTQLKTGSSKNVQAAVQDLYASIYKNTDKVSVAIRTAILNSTYASDSEPLTGTLVFTAAIGNSDDTYFPGNVNLPDGAALLKFDSGTFTQETTGGDNTGITGKYADYVYPASLYYYCNSGIGTATSSQVNNYDGSKNWNTILGGYTPHTAVQPATRSVAILNAIQYAVGRLDMSIRTQENTLYDKKGEPYTVTADGFTVTGVLIGGQKQVVWDFTPTTESVPEYTIYDNITESQSGVTLKAVTKASPDASDYNYTLALETPVSQSIYVAVELLNNGADFQGFDGVVHSGCKFYLVAELNVVGKTDDDGSTTDPASYTHTNGGTITNPGGVDKVFKQDYKTIANFIIPTGYSKDSDSFPSEGNNKGLGKAYNTIPDLRTPKLELGLSVDLSWEKGIQYDINIGQ